jgi:hypothetical protein
MDLILIGPDSHALTHIVAQSEDRIQFRVPLFPVASRYSIALLLENRGEGELEDQQVYITILAN